MGTTGSGKTFRLQQMLEHEHRCFLFDLMADPKFQEWGVLVDSPKDALRLASRTENFHIRMQFDDVDAFDFICSLCVKQPHGLEVLNSSCVAVDELSLLCTPHWIPEHLANLIRLGRHTDAKFIATTQRPPDINQLVLSQAREWHLFQMHLPRDVDYLKKFVPDIERVRSLPRGEAIVWTPSQVQDREEEEVVSDQEETETQTDEEESE
jgi:hypothetical protein